MDVDDWSAYSDAELTAFAEVTVRLARDLRREAPSPRGSPRFGLDMSFADPLLLDRFSRHGIFRKYQRAVALGSGLGGVQRWWAVHFGCSVLSVDPHPGVVAAAQILGARTGLGERVSFRQGPLDALPLKPEQFTHAWSVEGLASLGDPTPLLAEAMRVLRPAGLLTVILPADEATLAQWAAATAATGFLPALVKPLQPPELPYTVYYAEHCLRAVLEEQPDPHRRARLLEIAARLSAARASRAARVLLFAERPS